MAAAASGPLSFRPPAWLANPHLQTVLSSQYPRRHYVHRRARGLLRASTAGVLDCGDGVRLAGAHTPGRSDRALVVVIHGWEGSAASSYVLSLAAELHRAGYGVYRLNLRDHGDTHDLNSGVFHSCRLAEVAGAVRAIRDLFRPARLAVAGFSLGGNFALRVAADAPAGTVDRALAICPVLDPARTMTALETGPAIYRRYFLRKWRRSLLAKQRAWPGHYENLRPLELGPGLARMTEDLVLAYTEFPSVERYLAGYALTGARLSSLAVPSSILAALDDPIIPADDLGRLARPRSLDVAVEAAGGHCGFLRSLAGASAADEWVLHTLRGAWPGADEPAGNGASQCDASGHPEGGRKNGQGFPIA